MTTFFNEQHIVWVEVHAVPFGIKNRGLVENHPLFIDEFHSYINLKSIKNLNVYFGGSCIGVQ
jgi:hypothetical protein